MSLAGRLRRGRGAGVLAALGLGAVSAFALPPYGWAPLLLVSLPLLLRLIDAAPSGWSAARRGFAWGLGYHLIGVWWITEAILVRADEFWWAVPFAVPLLAGVLAVFVAVPAGLARGVARGWPRVAALSGLWVLGDLARQFVLTGFPWNPLGTALAMKGAPGDVLLQGAALVGMHGLTLVVALAGFSLALGARGAGLSAALIGGMVAYGAARLGPAQPLGMHALLVQPAVSQAEYLRNFADPAWRRAMFQRALDLTASGVARYREPGAPPLVVLWPEAASPYWLAQDQAAREMVAQTMAPARMALIGAGREAGPGDERNAMIAVAADGRVAGAYDKSHLVPYGEYFPSYLPIKLGENGWTPGPGIRSLHLPGLPPVGGLICYEAIFSGQVVDARDRPMWLANITDDAWFGDSAGPRQHLVQARLRAIEEGLPLLRAANTGISAVIDPYGRITGRLDLGLRGSVAAAVAAPLAPPLAARLGLWGPLMLALLLAGLGFWRGGAGFVARERGQII